jgi:predicted PurR-regulated permease PerM
VDEERRGVLSHPVVARVARWGVVAWSLIGIGYLGLILYRYVISPVAFIFPPLLIALFIVYLLNPIVSRLEARGLKRGWGALLTYLVFLGLLVVGMRFLVPVVADQVSEFAKGVPDLLSRAQVWVTDVVDRLKLDIDTSRLFSDLGPGGIGGQFIGRIFSFTAGVVHVAVVVVLGLVLGFYLLVDLPKMRRAGTAMIPSRRRPAVHSISEQMSRALGGYFRGQLLVALFVAVASMLALWIVGLPYWALVGLLAGLFNLIPLIGPFIAAVPALFVAFTTDQSEGLLHLRPGWPLAIGSMIALLVVQQIDNHIVSPNVVARTVKLHPITVMLGLLVAGSLLGLWGMLLAVPVIAAVKIVLLYFWDTSSQWPPAPSEPESEPSAARPSRWRRGPRQAAEVAEDLAEERAEELAEERAEEAVDEVMPTTEEADQPVRAGP